MGKSKPKTEKKAEEPKEVKKVPCEHCKATGLVNDRSELCEVCEGHGSVIEAK